MIIVLTVIPTVLYTLQTYSSSHGVSGTPGIMIPQEQKHVHQPFCIYSHCYVAISTLSLATLVLTPSVQLPVVHGIFVFCLSFILFSLQISYGRK